MATPNHHPRKSSSEDSPRNGQQKGLLRATSSEWKPSTSFLKTMQYQQSPLPTPPLPPQNGHMGRSHHHPPSYPSYPQAHRNHPMQQQDQQQHSYDYPPPQHYANAHQNGGGVNGYHHSPRQSSSSSSYSYNQQYQQQQQHQHHLHGHAPPLQAIPPLPPQQPMQPLMGTDLEDAVLQQVEFYFSDDNLSKDKFLLKKMRGGTVPLNFICSFPRLKKLTSDKQLVAHVINRSQLVMLSRDGKRVGRKDNKQGESAYRIIVELSHLGPEATEESVRAIVEPFGALAALDFGWDDDEDVSSSSGKTPTHHYAYVEFNEAEAALRCVEQLGASASWRGGYRTSFLNGLSIAQVAKHLGKKLGGDEGKNGALLSSSSSASAAGGESEARLPPVIPEGQHIGVIAELSQDGKQGVIKREGRRRSNVSFALPEGLKLSIGDRVDFVVIHQENKAVVTTVAKTTSAPPPPSESASQSKGAGGGTGAKSRMAKGPNGSIGFKFKRTVKRALEICNGGAAVSKSTEGEEKKGGGGANSSEEKEESKKKGDKGKKGGKGGGGGRGEDNKAATAADGSTGSAGSNSSTTTTTTTTGKTAGIGVEGATKALEAVTLNGHGSGSSSKGKVDSPKTK